MPRLVGSLGLHVLASLTLAAARQAPPVLRRRLLAAVPDRRCRRQSGRSAIPEHLLAAIGRVESGRRDPRPAACIPGPGRSMPRAGALLRHQGAGDRRGAGHAGARRALDRRRLHADQPDAPSGRLRHPGAGVRPAGQRRLRGAVPERSSTARPATGPRRRRCTTRRPPSSAPTTSAGCSRSGRRSKQQAGLSPPPLAQAWAPA